MSDSTIQKLRENFNNQLTQATTQISNLEGALVNLKKQQEQLRGAIFALDTVLQTQATETAAAQAPVTPAPAADATAPADTTPPATSPDASSQSS